MSTEVNPPRPVDRPAGTAPAQLISSPEAARPVPEPIPAGQPPTQLPQLDTRHLHLLRAADLTVLATSAIIGAAILQWWFEPVRAGDLTLREVIITTLAMTTALQVHGLYRRPSSQLRPSGWWRPWVIARCLPTAVLLSVGSEAALFGRDRVTLTAAVVMTLPAIALVPIGRRVAVRLFGPPTLTRILVLGTGQVAERLISRLSRCQDTFVVGCVDDNPAPGRHVLGGLADLPELCVEHKIDRIIVAFLQTKDHDVLDSIRRLGGVVPISVVPRLFELHSWRSDVEELHGIPLMHVPPATLEVSARAAKRSLDLVLSLITLAVLLPLWLVIAVAIRVDSPGPVYFRQERIGRANVPFRIFKFRTMTADAWERRATVAADNEVDGPLFKMAHDPRITRVGEFLRRTSLDELPQLLNVVRGEMSLVGPRPLPTEESDRLDGAALARFDVAPGITGLWQVSGRSNLSYADLQHLDSVYVRSWSLMWDLRIIRDTPRSVLGRHGAY